MESRHAAQEEGRQPETEACVLVCGRNRLGVGKSDQWLGRRLRMEWTPGELKSLPSAVQRLNPDVVVVDLASEDASQLQHVVQEIIRLRPHTSLVLVSDGADSLDAGRFLRAGGYQVVDWEKGGAAELQSAVVRAADRADLLSRLHKAEHDLSRAKRILEIRDWVESSVLDYGKRLGFRGMIGNSEKMQELYERIERLAKYPDLNVTVLGERGTGKSLVAKALHDLGPRGDEPFLKFLCSRFQSADPRITMCELFGWGAKPPVRDLDPRGGRGLLEEAAGGTILLDELGDIPPLGQNLLLDVVETRRFIRPLGKPDAVEVGSRFLFATNRPPRDLLDSRVLRRDFWDRISEALFVVPPLRQRADDIPLLVEHFLKLYNSRFGLHVERFTQTAVGRLKTHAWPGNVRELESTVRRALVLSNGEVIDEPDLEIHIGSQDLEPVDALVDRLWELIESGKLRFSDVVEFKVEWGREITRRLVHRAVKTEGSLKAAGTKLGVYKDADDETPRYAKFRSDAARLRSRVAKR